MKPLNIRRPLTTLCCSYGEIDANRRSETLISSIVRSVGDEDEKLEYEKREDEKMTDETSNTTCMFLFYYLLVNEADKYDDI